MLLAFDLDETLLDSRKAVYEAYHHVGVEMPLDAWGKPWRNWLDDEDAHDAKNYVYPEFLQKFGRPLPLRDLCVANPSSLILTGASKEGASRSLEFLGLDVLDNRFFHSLSRSKKIETLRKITWSQGKGLYFDDDKVTITLLNEANIGWSGIWTPLLF